MRFWGETGYGAARLLRINLTISAAAMTACAFAHPLTEVLRIGARALLAQAVKAEVTALSRNA